MNTKVTRGILWLRNEIQESVVTITPKKRRIYLVRSSSSKDKASSYD
ncbi:hypothetical protein ACUC2M_04920 [Bacillus cytotoxicus]